MNNANLFFYVCLALTAVFVFLKITKRVRWSWLIVLGPLWAPMLLGVVAAFLLPIVMGPSG